MRTRISSLFVLLVLSLYTFPAAAQSSRINWIVAGHKGEISSISYAPNDSFFVSAAFGDPHVIIWDGATGNFQRWFDFDSTLEIVKVAPDSRLMALANDRSLFLYDLKTNNILRSISDSTTIQIQEIAFSPTGDTLAWVSNVAPTQLPGDQPGLVSRYSLSSGHISTGRLPTITMRSLDGSYWFKSGQFEFTRQLDRLAFLGDSGIGMYSLKFDSLLFQRRYNSDMPPRGGFINEDSEFLSSTTSDSMALFDANTGAVLLTLTLPIGANLKSIHQIARDTAVVVEPGTTLFLKLPTLDTIASVTTPLSQYGVLEWSANNKYFLTGAEVTLPLPTGDVPPTAPLILRYDVARKFSQQLVTVVVSNLNSVRFSPTSSATAAGSDGCLSLLDSNGNLLNSRQSLWCGSLAYSHDGTKIGCTNYSGAWYGGGYTEVSDATSLSPLFSDGGSGSYTAKGSPFNQLNFNSHDDSLAIGDSIISLPPQSQDQLLWPGTLFPDSHYLNAYLPNGHDLCYTDDDTIRIEDVTTGQEIESFPTMHGHINAFRLNHDGTELLTCGTDGLIRLWKTSDHSLIRTFSGYRASITGVQFSPNEFFVISSSLDSSIRIWDINSGVVVDSFSEFKAPYTDVQVAQDGKHILASTPLALVEYGAPRLPLESVGRSMGTTMTLGDAYPNPFGASTTINFSLAKREFVTLRVTNMLGETLSIPVNGIYDAGEHALHIENINMHLRPGAYFYELTTLGASQARMMLVE